MDLVRVRRVLGRGLGLRCPRCGEAPLFERGFRMREACPRCRLTFEREAGYWVGAIYINYAVTVGLALGGYFLVEWLWAPSPRWQVGIWSAFVIAFPLASYRHSKSLWLCLDHLVDPRGPTMGAG